MDRNNLVNLRCIIYLTIMNALSYEAVHKLLKIELQEGQEVRALFFCYVTYEKLTILSRLSSYAMFYGLSAVSINSAGSSQTPLKRPFF